MVWSLVKILGAYIMILLGKTSMVDVSVLDPIDFPIQRSYHFQVNIFGETRERMTRQTAQYPERRRSAPTAFLLFVSLVLTSTAVAADTGPLWPSSDPVVTVITAHHPSHQPPASRPVASVWEENNVAKASAGFTLAPSLQWATTDSWLNVHRKGKKIPHQVYRPPRTHA